MYPHLSPHGLVMKINRQPLAELSDKLVRRDREYWTRYIQAMIGDWLHDGTSVGDVVAFIEKVHANHDLSGFKCDPRFVQNDAPPKSFSKLRSSIGGLYAWRGSNAGSPDEKERMLAEADYAFRQALALCPRGLDALFRYTSLLAEQRRTEAAAPLVECALKLQPQNVMLIDLFLQF